MELKNNLYVVSLTHWDREWRFPFEKTRMLLVDMLDDVLKVLDEDPDYSCFHLDGQTILLDDYCAVRPENADRISDYVLKGRLIIGPWYVLPEENQMSGESLVRNFLWGERLGRKYGGNMKVGYSPTSWGQVSQMPQIMRGFGINSTLFYRGISADQVPGRYYEWEGADDSRLFAIRLGDYARASFFHLVDRPLVFNRSRSDQSHEWTLGGKPFRLSGSGSATPYQFCHPPSGWYPERIETAFKDLEDLDLGQWETPFALAMECDDSTGPFVLTTKIINAARKQITNGKQIIHGNLAEFVKLARKHLQGKELTVVKGEMRNCQRAGLWTDLYAEVQATRMPLKYANRRAELAVQRVAEPIATVAWMLGAPYPLFALDRANELLLQSHAHDSIGGCGVDAVADDVMYRFRQVRVLADIVTENATRSIAEHINLSGLRTDEVLLIVYNHLPRPISGIAKGEIDIAKDRKVRNFKICTLDGLEVALQISGTRDNLATFNHPQELPLRTWSNHWELLFEANMIPAMGYKVFRVIPIPVKSECAKSLLTSHTTMENQFLHVQVNANGTIDVINKADGTILRNQNIFQDRGEVGDYWVGTFPKHDTIVTSLESVAQITPIATGSLSASIEVVVYLNLPIEATPDTTARLAETRPVRITTVYTLNKLEKFIRITTTIENTVKDHILRTLFPTNVKTDIVHAETPFDVVERRIPLPDTQGWREPYKPVQPHRSFVDLSDGVRGVALLNRGLPQYEAVDNVERSLALTLFRAHRAWNSVRLAYYPDEIGTQLQGVHTFEYALMPHTGTWEHAGVAREAEWFNLPFSVAACGAGNGTLPPEASFLQLEGHGLNLDTLKKGEWDDSVIIRVSNPTKQAITGTITLWIKTGKVEVVNLMETEVQTELLNDNGKITINVPAKKILTLRICRRETPKEG